MTRPSPALAYETDEEYRAIEAALLESARGRWFLAEHGRRARRLDSALLEDAIARLKTSIREPPALLDQLQSELGGLRAHLASLHASMLDRPRGPVSGIEDGTHPRALLKAVEDVHELAWSLQANPFDPKGCEQIARNAAQIYVLSQEQAEHAARTLTLAQSVETAIARVDAVLDTLRHERTIDAAVPPVA